MNDSVLMSITQIGSIGESERCPFILCLVERYTMYLVNSIDVFHTDTRKTPRIDIRPRTKV